MTPEALIFDLDGLLLNTEVFSQRAFHATCADFETGDLSALFLSLVGTNEQHHTQRLKEALPGSIDSMEFRSKWNESFHHMLATEQIDLLPGVPEILHYAKEAGITCAVATSSATEAGEKKLKDAGIRDYFKTVTCGDQVAISKPHPEIFEKAAASVNADVSRSIGFEDSPNGVRSAHAAGLNVVQIPNLVQPTEELLSLGYRVCDSMHDVVALLKNDALL